MSTRVNMLQPDERRYQGPVSLRFMVHVAVVTIVALLALSVARAGVGYLVTQHSLKVAEQTWSKIEARTIALESIREHTGKGRHVVDELNAWQNSNLPWTMLLRTIQQAAPASIQFVNLDIRDRFAMPSKDADKKHSHTPLRQMRIQLSGESYGDQSEARVLAFVEALQAHHPTDAPPIFETISLDSMQLAEDRSGVVRRTFNLSGTGPERWME